MSIEIGRALKLMVPLTLESATRLKFVNRNSYTASDRKCIAKTEIRESQILLLSDANTFKTISSSIGEDSRKFIFSLPRL